MITEEKVIERFRTHITEHMSPAELARELRIIEKHLIAFVLQDESVPSPDLANAYYELVSLQELLTHEL